MQNFSSIDFMYEELWSINFFTDFSEFLRMRSSLQRCVTGNGCGNVYVSGHAFDVNLRGRAETNEPLRRFRARARSWQGASLFWALAHMYFYRVSCRLLASEARCSWRLNVGSLALGSKLFCSICPCKVDPSVHDVHIVPKTWHNVHAVVCSNL